MRGRLVLDLVAGTRTAGPRGLAPESPPGHAESGPVPSRRHDAGHDRADERLLSAHLINYQAIIPLASIDTRGPSDL